MGCSRAVNSLVSVVPSCASASVTESPSRTGPASVAATSNHAARAASSAATGMEPASSSATNAYETVQPRGSRPGVLYRPMGSSFRPDTQVSSSSSRAAQASAVSSGLQKPPGVAQRPR